MLMRECWLVNGTLVRSRCSSPHGFWASEQLTGIIRRLPAQPRLIGVPLSFLNPRRSNSFYRRGASLAGNSEACVLDTTLSKQIAPLTVGFAQTAFLES